MPIQQKVRTLEAPKGWGSSVVQCDILGDFDFLSQPSQLRSVHDNPIRRLLRAAIGLIPDDNDDVCTGRHRHRRRQ
jgi:hypothetical protein